MSTVDLSTIIDAASAKLTTSYELEEEFVASVKKALQQVLKKYYIYDSPQQVVAATSGGGKKEKKEKKENTDKKPRKKSAYNVFVQEKMPEFKDVPHKERMGKIGALWKGLDEAGKAPFQAKADALNAQNEAEATATATDAQ